MLCIDFIIVPISEDSAEKEEGGELPKKPHTGTCAGEASGGGIYLWSSKSYQQWKRDAR